MVVSRKRLQQKEQVQIFWKLEARKKFLRLIINLMLSKIVIVINLKLGQFGQKMEIQSSDY